MHKLAGEIEAGTRLPLLHIADAAAQAITALGLQKIGLLGTRFTMQEEFYKNRLTTNFGLEVIVPTAEECTIIDRVIYQELVLGRINPVSKRQYLDVIENLIQAGAQGVILGCTEIGLLVKPHDCQVPLFDTTRIHAVAAVDYALQSSPTD